MEELDRVTLRIAIIADNLNAANECYQRFINDNRDIVLIPGKNKTILNDGTIIEKYSVHEVERLRGVRLDQALLCVENEANIKTIRKIMELLMLSQVPKSYWLLCYEEE